MVTIGKIFEWISNNKGLFFGLLIGFVVAILFLTIGFWATFLIALCMGIGAFLGTNPAARKAISVFFYGLFTKKKD